jgi:hypothetical protein
MKGKVEPVTEVRNATERFVAECVSVGRDQWMFRPEQTSWSMSHIAEHVALGNGNLYRVLVKPLLNGPPLTRTTDVTDDEIPYLFYRGEEPPNIAAPSGSWTDQNKATTLVKESSTLIAEWAAGVAVDLRKLGASHPAFGLMDGVQWLLFAAAHMERHRAQLVGLKRHPGFPTG